MFLCLCFASPPARSQTARYPQEIARRWLTLDDVAARVDEKVSLEIASGGAPILHAAPVPFQDVGLIPTTHPSVSPQKLPTQWELPPFPLIGPPSASDAPPEAVADAGAPAFQGVDVAEPPSALLRPLPAPPKRASTFRDFAIPDALSRVRFTSSLAGVCQLSVYGGTTSFAAEDAYRALTAALSSKEELKGVGREALLGVYEDPSEKPSARPEGPGFADIPPVGARRPELMDPGLNAARQAPAFKDISTQPRSGPPALDFSHLPRSAPARPQSVPHSYWVALIYMPDKAVTLELSMDQRLGTPQGLVDLALLLQTRVREQE